eukprot:TRINITY_DN25466_c0_g1_i1.p1 TRINITY_DN25466_c0_g1~~TRINITY_DN25466_c0_g1_i1.p1  ORF type:complete len:198 (+),score=29.73 TRINITY_DN25466_c0_g1_i1:76-594(+)
MSGYVAAAVEVKIRGQKEFKNGCQDVLLKLFPKGVKILYDRKVTENLEISVNGQTVIAKSFEDCEASEEESGLWPMDKARLSVAIRNVLEKASQEAKEVPSQGHMGYVPGGGNSDKLQAIIAVLVILFGCFIWIQFIHLFSFLHRGSPEKKILPDTWGPGTWDMSALKKLWR